MYINNLGSGDHMLSPHRQNTATYTRHKKLCIATYVYVIRPQHIYCNQVIPHRQQGLRQPHLKCLKASQQMDQEPMNRPIAFKENYQKNLKIKIISSFC